MAACSSLWILLTIIFSALPTNNGSIAYVRPSSAGSSTCPDQPCLSFNDYAREKDRYFLEGTTFMFLSGVHQLDLRLQLENVSSISLGPLEGNNSVQILLDPMVNISWLDSNNVTITGLDIFLSGLPNDESLFSSLAFQNITNCLLSRLHFFGNDSWQSTAIRTHSSVVNLTDVMVSGATSLYGPALIAFNSTINFNRQNSFMNNRATQGGGAMYIIQSVVSFRGSVSFVNNIVFSISGLALGGAIHCQTSVLSFSGSALFMRNIAAGLDFNVYGARGGGISAWLNSILTFEVSSSTAFTENVALDFGGAISIGETELIMNGNALFEANRGIFGGGAMIGFENSKILCHSSGEQITFRNNTSNAMGGAIYTQSSTVELKGILFERNVAPQGGAIFSEDYLLHIFTCDFHNNTALLDGGAVLINGTYYYGIAIFNGTNNFQWNVGGESSAVRLGYANVTISGTNKFMYNNATFGPGSLAFFASSGIVCGNLTFYRNYATWGSGLHGILSDLSICGNNLFIENHADSSGGGMNFFMCNLNITSQADFLQNTARFDGSSVKIHDSSVMIGGSMNISSSDCSSSFSNCYVDGSLRFLNCAVTLIGVLILENNTAYTGGAISADDSEVDFVGCVKCINNKAQRSGGALYAKNSTVMVRSSSNCNIFQTNIAAERGGAIYVEDSIISLSGSQRFLFNSADKGGAVAIDTSSKLVLAQPLQASFIKNNASVGGAIFYEDTFSASQCTSSTNRGNNYCFIELDSTSNIQLSFLNNTATSAGTVLYGGNFDSCRLYTGGGFSDSCGNRVGGNYSDNPIATIFELSESVSVDNMTSNVSSDPLQICFCDSNVVQCPRRINIAAIRGKEFTLMVLIIGQNHGIIPSLVRISLDNEIQISAAQRIQATGKECTPIRYRLSSIKNTTTLTLFPDGPCRDNMISRSEITINFLPCPDGFTLDGSECVCEERLQRYTNGCNVDDNSILRDSNTFWIGAVYENGTYGGLILHSGCPFDYCVDTPVLIAVDNLENQCNHNHSGILCGACVNGYSTTFGTLHCLPCTNAYLALIIPFALAGIVLVAVLLLLNISVASGTINGLIFYANVIQVNHSVFFSPETTNILTVFIAWLNLDLGIETCFFNGMNAYIFTWLQFVFPLYIWFLIGLIIMISRFSEKIARSLGKNPVTALATLLHLSYSKILRTIIVALSSTTLEYPGNNHQVVWLYDGNIPYFQSASYSHIVLGTVAILVLLFLFLPYTLLLLCGHWLLACSDRWIFSWLNKIMPLMDAYHAPYNKESRYWTGFLLLIRCALFLTFAFNTLGNVSGNLLAIVSVTAGLMVLSWLRGRIYKNIFNDCLEAAFILNLCILAAGTYHVKEIGGNQAGLAYTSVGIVFVLFLCILLYHMYLRLRTTVLWKKMHNRRHYILGKLTLSRNKENDIEGNVVNVEQKSEVVQLPTVTTIELNACEPQLL